MGLGRLAAGLAVAVLAVLAWRGVTSADPAMTALQAHVAAPSRDEQAYPHYAGVLRGRAWLASAPGMPTGVEPFSSLPDAVLGNERALGPGELRATLSLINGLVWDQTVDGWKDGERVVSRAQVLQLLKAALPTPADARAVCDLLAGTANADLPDLATQLRRASNGLRGIHLRPFSGDRGRLLIDAGRPPYRERETGYSGCLASFDGDGWPVGWRVLHLQRH